MKLSFSRGNSKLPKSTLIFSIPAGHTCPGAKVCLSKADKETGLIKDGRFTEFRCYAASAECAYPSVRESRWGNLDSLLSCKTADNMASLIYEEIVPHLTRKRKSPNNVIQRVRIHESGDFFSRAYFIAWAEVAKRIDNILFYGFTKCLPTFLECSNLVPDNLIITASAGGKYDGLLSEFTRISYVVNSREEAELRGLPIDHDDTFAYEKPPQAFAHLVHGVQPAGSKSMAALLGRKRAGDFYGYSKRN